jgi:hypothetical protein
LRLAAVVADVGPGISRLARCRADILE